jgi:hypothetical protein
VETNDSNTYQGEPSPKNGTFFCGDEGSCRNRDQGHRERPGAGSNEIVFESVFEPLSFFSHNVMSIRESQPPGKSIKEAERVDFSSGKRVI